MQRYYGIFLHSSRQNCCEKLVTSYQLPVMSQTKVNHNSLKGSEKVTYAITLITECGIAGRVTNTQV